MSPLSLLLVTPYCILCYKSHSDEFKETQKYSFISRLSVVLLFIIIFLIFPVKFHVFPCFAMQPCIPKADQDTSIFQPHSKECCWLLAHKHTAKALGVMNDNLWLFFHQNLFWIGQDCVFIIFSKPVATVDTGRNLEQTDKPQQYWFKSNKNSLGGHCGSPGAGQCPGAAKAAPQPHPAQGWLGTLGAEKMKRASTGMLGTHRSHVFSAPSVLPSTEYLMIIDQKTSQELLKKITAFC